MTERAIEETRKTCKERRKQQIMMEMFTSWLGLVVQWVSSFVFSINIHVYFEDINFYLTLLSRRLKVDDWDVKYFSHHQKDKTNFRRIQESYLC